jgi:NADPH-dependent glutamate synthase beta subunit-like oxidoreductase
MLQIQKESIARSASLQKEWVMSEASRCLNCYDAPCRKACPASINIPQYIISIKSGNLPRAATIVRHDNPMAVVCGVICPAEVFCQAKCTRGKIDEPIRIRELHSYATQFEDGFPLIIPHEKRKVAVVGAGPSGLACAAKLTLKGIQTTIFDQSPYPGGVPRHSIPRFRLDDEDIDIDIDYVKNIGVAIASNSRINDPSILLKEYDAVFMGVGLSSHKKLGIPCEELLQVLEAVQFLEMARSGKQQMMGKRNVVVIGGGNVSLDVAATAAHLKAKEVHLLYRRGMLELRAWESEYKLARKMGVIIDYLTLPIEFISISGKLAAVKCLRTKLLNDRDADGRRKSVQLPNSEFLIPADMAIVAIGMTSDYKPEFKTFGDLTTSIDGVFAGGEWLRGSGTVVEAVRDGKAAADLIISYLKGKKSWF